MISLCSRRKETQKEVNKINPRWTSTESKRKISQWEGHENQSEAGIVASVARKTSWRSWQSKVLQKGQRQGLQAPAGCPLFSALPLLTPGTQTHLRSLSRSKASSSSCLLGTSHGGAVWHHGIKAQRRAIPFHLAMLFLERNPRRRHNRENKPSGQRWS